MRIGQASEHAGEPGLRVDIVEFGGRDQRVDRSSAPAAFVGAGEGPVLSPQRRPVDGIAFNEHYSGDGAIIYKHACALGCEGIVSKRLGSAYRSGRAVCWLKVKNPAAPAVTRESEEDWGK